MYSMLNLLLAIILGILAGTLTGLVPGLHTNAIAIMIAGISGSMLFYFSPLSVAAFLISMIIVHSFVDFIPSIFLGAPEEATVLSVLPGHELLAKGLGFKALKLTIVGGIGTFILSLAIIPIMFLFLESNFELIRFLTAPLLIIFSILFILQERTARKIVWAILIFILSGALGLLVLNSTYINQPLFPLLSGLFGVSTIFLSMFRENKITKQIIDVKVNFISKARIFSYLKAALSSLFVSILPAIGSAQAAIISRAFTNFRDKEEFLVILGGINTAATIFTLTTLFLIDKARTGVVVVIQDIIQLKFSDYLLLLFVCFVSLIFAVYITLKIGKLFAQNISTINYKKVSLLIIAFITLLVGFFSGLLGLFILFVSACIGLIAPLTGVRRIHLMAVLVIPVVTYYI